MADARPRHAVVPVRAGALLAAPGLGEIEELLATAPRLPLRKPRLWPGAEPAPSTVQLGWDAEHLFALFRCTGAFAPPRRSDALARWEEKEGVHPAQRTLLCDDRVQVFVMPPVSEHYFGFEVNAGGGALTYRVDAERFARTGAMDWSWGGDGAEVCAARCFASPGAPAGELVVLVAVRWGAVGVAPAAGAALRVQLNRNHADGSQALVMSEHAKRAGVGDGGDEVARAEAEAWGSMRYTSATDAGDDEVNFHRPQMFAGAVLQ